MRTAPVRLAALLVLTAACSEGGTEPKVVPAPVLTSVSPNETPAGSPDLTVTLTGSDFQQGSQARFNSTGLATTYVSGTELRAVIPATLLQTGAQASLAVFTLEAAALSQPQTFTVYYHAPTFTGMSRDSETAGTSNPPPVTVTGTGFAFGTTVLWNGQPLTTLYQSPTTVTFIPPVATPGVAEVVVRNPEPRGGSSAARTFTIHPAAG